MSLSEGAGHASDRVASGITEPTHAHNITPSTEIPRTTASNPQSARTRITPEEAGQGQDSGQTRAPEPGDNQVPELTDAVTETHRILSLAAGVGNSTSNGVPDPNPESPGGNQDNQNHRKRRFDAPGGPGDPSPPGRGGEENHDPHVNWSREQSLLRTMISTPGEHPLMPIQWAGNFKGYPLPAGLFYRRTRSESVVPRIYERTPGQAFHGSKVFLEIAKVQARVRDVYFDALDALGDQVNVNNPGSSSGGDLQSNPAASSSPGGSDRDDSRENNGPNGSNLAPFRRRIVKVLRPAIEGAISWAWKDGGLTNYGDALPTNIGVFGVAQLDEPDKVWAQIQRRLDAMAQRWRDRVKEFEDRQKGKEVDRGGGHEKALRPPTVFAFAIVFNKLVIVHQNPQAPEPRTIIEAVLDMETDNQRQWYSMIIMMTICWARDILMRTVVAMDLQAEEPSYSSDPDA